jgi:hypothetical protein
MSTEFSCWYGGEGTSRGVQANGTPMISTDGIRWQPLPFAEFSYDTEARETVHTGSIVRLAIATDAGLVLGGESNGNVTFWLGESPDLSPSGAPFDDDPAEVTGVLRGDRTQGIDCIWLTDPQGNRWEIIWPAGYRQEVVEGVATLSLDDQVVAVAGDNITVRGARSSEFGSVCMIGIVYEAAEVIVE